MNKIIKFIFVLLVVVTSVSTTVFATETTDTNSDKTPSEQTQTVSPSTEDTTTPTSDVGLQIDNENKYENMEKSYHDGYVPTIKDNNVYLLLPLVGKTYNNTVNISVDLGQAENSPFVFGNYNQTITNENLYLFQVVIPLKSSAINGTYPIMLNAEYININGEKITQNYTLYVTITTGITPVDPNATPEDTAPEKEAAECPDLYISECIIAPSSIGGNEEFDVTVTINNIGNLKARNIKLTYGETGNLDIVPVSAINVMNIDNISNSETNKITFKMKTTENITGGIHSFPIQVDYVDYYGGVYTFTQQFTINITRTTQIDYDALAIPKQTESGTTLELPVNIFNIGKSILKNVKISLEGDGLTPISSVYLGDIDVGLTGNGTLSVFVGTLENGNYGNTVGTYTISYDDETGETQSITNDFTFKITEPKSETTDATTEEVVPVKQPDVQWWVSLLIGLAIIAIIVSFIITGRIIKANKMRH